MGVFNTPNRATLEDQKQTLVEATVSQSRKNTLYSKPGKAVPLDDTSQRAQLAKEMSIYSDFQKKSALPLFSPKQTECYYAFENMGPTGDDVNHLKNTTLTCLGSSIGKYALNGNPSLVLNRFKPGVNETMSSSLTNTLSVFYAKTPEEFCQKYNQVLKSKENPKLT